MIARNSAGLDTDTVSLGYNLAAFNNVIQNSDSTDDSASLAAIGLASNLQYNGGIELSVLSYALAPDSVAIDNGAPNNTGTSIVDTTGTNRGDTSDIGAFEFRQPDVTNGPSVVVNEGLVVDPEKTTAITFTLLNAVDPDTPAADIEYFVTNAPAIGNLQNNGVIVNQSDTFCLLYTSDAADE